MEGIEVVPSLEEGIAAAADWNNKNNLEEEIVLIGGGYVFVESILLVNKLVLQGLIVILREISFIQKLILRNGQRLQMNLMPRTPTISMILGFRPI